MYEFRVDVKKNRLYLTLGRIVGGEAEQLDHQITEVLPELTPGFSVISDISQFVLEDSNETFYVDKILRSLADAGVKKVVRVTGRPVKRNVETTTEYGYSVMLAENLETAEAYLDRE